MDEVYLRSIEFEGGGLIHLWPFVQISDDSRLYYDLDDPGSGFRFYSVMWTSCSGEHDKDIWNLDSVTVECGIHGYARFDGIRHLYWGDETTNNYGYHYYPRMEDEIKTLQALRELEKQHCRDYE